MTGPIVVLGDVMLDVDRSGESERLSPEAPVPVLHHLSDRRRAGGAGLAAMLAARFGPRPVVLVAPFADDDAAGQVRELLAGRVDIVALPWTGSTPVKTRLRIGSHPVARLDEGGEAGTITSIPAAVPALLRGAGAILVADYGRGATGCQPLRDMVSAVIGTVPVVWDPHPNGSPPVPGVSLVTPNEAELRHFVSGFGSGRAERSSVPQRRRAARQLLASWQPRGVCVTLGANGAMLCLGDNPPFIVPAQPVHGGDSCGAGDCFAAAVACALAQGALPSEAVNQAVGCAGSFVAAGGAAGLHPESAGRRESSHRTVSQLLDRVRGAGGVVVATGGCFDLLHAGHVATLEAARALGDCLIVCLNSDRSVVRLKGAKRPLQPAADRARVLAALQAVDAVVIFEQDTPVELLRTIRPDLWAKGGDYAGLELPEAAVLAEWGGEAVTVPYLDGRSTSSLVEMAAQLPASS